MNIVELIKKLKEEGFKSLSESEVQMLVENKSLLSVSQQKELDTGTEQAEADAKGDTENEEKEKPEGEGEKEDEGIDEKGIRDLIGKSIQDGVETNMDAIAETLVAKFFKRADVQRKNAIDTGKSADDKSRSSTREFLKALVTKDTEYLKKHVSTATDDTAKGGYTIPEELLAEVLRIAETQYGFARRNFRYLPFSGAGNSRKIPSLASSVSVAWTDEGASKTSTQPVFGLVTQTLKKLAAIVPFTEEIIEDSAINLTQLVAELFAEAVSKEEDIQFLTGSGSPWTGLLNNTETNQVVMDTGKTAHTDLTADNLLDMIDETPSGALPGSKFLMNRKILSVVRKLKDTQGNYIFQAPGQGLPATIWDYPFETSDALPTTAGVSENFIMFGNFRLAAIFGDKQQIRVRLLEEATIGEVGGGSINLAEQDMIALRMVERVGYVASLPSAMTRLTTAAV